MNAASAAVPVSEDPALEAETRPPLDTWVYTLAAVGTLIHFLFNSSYGYFRDELYYAACGQHLAWGYVDHAPLVALVSRVSRGLFGDSLFSLRLFPALSAAAKVYLAGWMARELGGGRFAQALVALAVLFAPIYLTFDNFLSMNAFEPVFWMACAAILLRILNGGNEKLWLLFGVVAGVGILNKHSMLFFCSGLLAGMLLTRARRQFARTWLWLGAACAFLIALPNFVWEARHGWPTIALLHAVIGTKYVTVTPWEFIWQQTLLTSPVAAPIWIGGLWFLFVDSRGNKYSTLGWAYAVVLAEMIALHGKIYYLAPIYPMLLAAGAVWVESCVPRRALRWARPAIFAPLIAAGAIAAPLAMPVLPVAMAVKYCRYWDVNAVRVEQMPIGDLPQLFGDMFGWREQVADVARVFDFLPDAERSECAVLAYNYGQAGAIDYFGRSLGLPAAISGHNQYGLWGPRGYSGQTVVAIGFTGERLREFFDEVTPAALVANQYAMPEETNLTIYVCHKPKKPLDQMWPKLRWLG
ncbi:MAG: glycosyltransferase family 39 protein [Candidatus Acidiferrum sp.]